MRVSIVSFGEGGALGDGEGLAFGKDGDFMQEPLLRFSVYLRKNVNVKVHLIGRASSDANEGSVPPAETVSEAALKTHLDRIFGDQANVFFNVRVGEVDYVDWDVATAADFDNAAAVPPYPGTRNKWFDVDKNQRSPEESAVLAASPKDNWADINIYLIGGCNGMSVHIHFPGQYYGSEWAFGVGKSEDDLVWIEANGNRELKKRSLLDTIAHEIGHILIGAGHAELPTYIHFLQGTDPEKRLMVGGVRYNINKTARLLVKSEWDAIQNTLQE